MAGLEDRVAQLIKDINALHDLTVKVNWSELNRGGFVLELSQGAKRLREIYSSFEAVDSELRFALEKNTPSLAAFLESFRKDMNVIESNLQLEHSKKVRDEIVNETEKIEVPELYASLQQKILELDLRARYNIDKVSAFLASKRMPFVKKGTTARNLVDLLAKKEDEISSLKGKHLELKRKTFFGHLQEESIADIEKDLHEMDKRLSTAVSETSHALKTHLAQMNYVEGSFGHLKSRLNTIEAVYDSYTKKTANLVKELKKERDYARTTALEIERETIDLRSEYTTQLLGLEQKKQEVEEKARAHFEKRIKQMEKDLEEKGSALKNLNKIVEDQEREIRRLKSAALK
jgi:hypothetical protein